MLLGSIELDVINFLLFRNINIRNDNNILLCPSVFIYHEIKRD